MNYYIEMLKKSIAKVEADFDFSAGIDHNASKGAFREQIIKKLLRPFLPGEYGISGGQAFDQDGNISKQLDIVIYDALHSYIAPYSDDFIYFPCESVYGNIEIKSNLNKQSLLDALSNIESLKNLKREPIDAYYITPTKPLTITGIDWNITATNDFLGVVFAYESSITTEKILEHIKNAVNSENVKKENIPNLIVLLKERKIITRFQQREDGMYVIQPLRDPYGLLVEECNESVLAEFLINLFLMLRSIGLKAMNIEEKSIQLHDEIFHRDQHLNETLENVIF